MRELSERECAIMNEAFTIGRIYNQMGEKESPSEIQAKLTRMCTGVAARAPAGGVDREMPIQSDSGRDATGAVRQIRRGSIPWWLAELAYTAYPCKDAQSLERIAERGGYGSEELLTYLRAALSPEPCPRPDTKCGDCPEGPPEPFGNLTCHKYEPKEPCGTTEDGGQ